MGSYILALATTAKLHPRGPRLAFWSLPSLQTTQINSFGYYQRHRRPKTPPKLTRYSPRTGLFWFCITMESTDPHAPRNLFGGLHDGDDIDTSNDRNDAMDEIYHLENDNALGDDCNSLDGLSSDDESDTGDGPDDISAVAGIER